MVSRISARGLKLIKDYEGFSATIYRDAAGYPTIGYGHLIKKGESFSEPMSRQDASVLLLSDVAEAEQAVRRLIPIALTQGQYDALVSFTFNLGSGALQSSTLRRKLLQGSVDSAAREFPRWVYAGGRKLRGLMRRRISEQKLFVT